MESIEEISEWWANYAQVLLTQEAGYKPPRKRLLETRDYIAIVSHTLYHIPFDKLIITDAFSEEHIFYSAPNRVVFRKGKAKIFKCKKK